MCWAASESTRPISSCLKRFLIPVAVITVSSGLAAMGGVLTIVGGFSLLGELANRSPRRAMRPRCHLGGGRHDGVDRWARRKSFKGRSRVPSPRTTRGSLVSVGGALTVMGVLGLQAREALARIELLAKFIFRAMQLGIVLLAAGTIAGGAWAKLAWGGFWGWDPKLVWALITLVVYLVPLHGRFAGWMNTFGLVAASVVCFMAVLMSWYGVNFVLRVGLHNYGFTEGGDARIVMAMCPCPARGCRRRGVAAVAFAILTNA